jgi:endonuclease I
MKFESDIICTNPAVPTAGDSNSFYTSHLKKNRKFFAGWDQQDPVDSWECERERRVAKIQGNRNPFVAEMCPVR